MGGKTFRNQDTGYNPASRIPTELIPEIENRIYNLFGGIFEKIQIVTAPDLFNKVDHGDIDFVVLKKNDSKNQLRDIAKNYGFENAANGNMEHILFPIEDKKYQVDFIFTDDQQEYETCLFFYSQPVVFNAIIGHFARSLGYKFSTMGLLLHITDIRGQNYYVELSRDLETIMTLLCLDYSKYNLKLYDDPNNFAQWIIESPRFDSQFFEDKFNKNAHRDAKRDAFCERSYKIVDDAKGIVCKIPPTVIDFKKQDFDLKKSLEFESKILGDDIVDRVANFCAEKVAVKERFLTGDFIIGLGYKPGKIIGDILKDVESKFEPDRELTEIEKYIRNNYPICS